LAGERRGNAVQEWAESFYKSMPWIRTRAAYGAERGWLCEDCLARGRVTPGVIVHHVIELTPQNIRDTAVSLDRSNLRLLCRDCHAAVHHPERNRRYSVDADGKVYIKADSPLSAQVR